jgi:hypothetical protein
MGERYFLLETEAIIDQRKTRPIGRNDNKECIKKKAPREPWERSPQTAETVYHNLKTPPFSPSNESNNIPNPAPIQYPLPTNSQG